MLVCVLSKLGNATSDWYMQLRNWIGGHAIVVDDVKKLNSYSPLHNNDGTVEIVCESWFFVDNILILSSNNFCLLCHLLTAKIASNQC